MTADKYFSMCEQTGEEPDPERIPPDIMDFPFDVQKAMLLYNKLGDRVYPDIGYIGKDLTPLELYMKVWNVENKRIFLETIIRLDTKMIEKSAAQMKAERDRIKRKA